MSLILGMVVRDEVDRYLDEVLIKAKRICDELVILDDYSEDDTPGICEDHGCHVYQHPWGEPVFMEQENKVREYLWRHCLPRHARRGDWILSIDADELIQPHFKEYKDKLMSQGSVNNYTMQIYEAWGDRGQIRIDQAWNPLSKHTPVMSRWLPQVNYVFPMLHLHSGRVPLNQPGPTVPSGFNILHLGWSDPEDIPVKYERYTRNDPDPHPLMKAHYDSILQDPTLMEWIF